VSTQSCSDLGEVRPVAVKGERNKRYYHTQFILSSEALRQLQSIAGCLEGVDSVERSDREGTSFVITLKPGVGRSATTVCNGLIARTCKVLERGQQQRLMGQRPERFPGMAVFAERDNDFMRNG
jgi:hypothetical protein